MKIKRNDVMRRVGVLFLYSISKSIRIIVKNIFLISEKLWNKIVVKNINVKIIVI